MKNIFSLSLLCFAFIANAQKVVPKPAAVTLKSTTRLIETVDKKSKDEIVIPYKKYVLSNGMTMLIHEDHSDPIVYVDITYHVGSAREQQGRSGFAHFFEHMMFQGSKHVADEQHFKTLTEAGGTLNGSTNTDRTNYWEVVPSNQLETALWLESDRMGFLLDSVTQPKFEVQRSTVKNERGQNYDNRPYGLVSEKLGEALYPQGHPYSWTTIGYIEDLNRVDVNDLKRFYLRWYGPNNSTITLSGDITPDQVIPLVEKYFGSIPPGPEVKAMAPTPGLLTENRYISYEDNIKFPMVALAWPSAEGYTQDAAALGALADMLSGSKSSFFQQALIKAKKAVSCNVFNADMELAGMFAIQIRANKDDSLSKMEKNVNDILQEYEKKGVTEEQLNRYKNVTKSQFISSLTTVRGKGATLAQYQTITHNADFIKKELDMLAKITIQDLANVYNKYIKGKPHVILSVVPKGKPELKAHEDTWKMYTRKIEQESAEYTNLSYKPLTETFDRNKKPVAGPSPVINAPVYWQDKFENGIKFIGTNDNEVPKVSIQISMDAGHRYEPLDKAGLAYLTASLLNESTQNHSSEEISDLVDGLGSEINVTCNASEITMNISSLTENTGKTLAFAEEILFKPKFSPDDFERAKKQQLDAIQQQQTSAAFLAEQSFNRITYGSTHIMSTPVIGTAASVGKLTLDDVNNYYKKYLSPSVTKVMIVGNLTQQQIMPGLQFLGKWANVEVVKQKDPAPPAIAKTMVYFIDKKAAPQSEIRIGKTALPYDATGEFYKSTVMAFPFGGSFNSRVN
ncbi:MAG TPA: pitrilysin family protein, partial [Bacteroidia bacterium]|nr:pitrilysin family protein [Bacteroidia bacterium]